MNPDANFLQSLQILSAIIWQSSRHDENNFGPLVTDGNENSNTINDVK